MASEKHVNLGFKFSFEALELLGAYTWVNNEMRAYDLSLSGDKRERYSADIKHCVETEKMSAGLASKLAGRRQYTTSLSAEPVGRSFIKAIHAQSRNFLGNQHVGNWLLWSQK